MKIIAFTAPKGAGKDTAADILIDAKKANGKISFAGPLKEICSKVFGVPPQLFSDPVLKERPFDKPIILTSRNLRAVKVACIDALDPYKYDYNANKATINGLEGMEIPTPRKLLQVIGTDFIRDRIYQNWHVSAAFSEERLASLPGTTYCVTDARFINEYDFLVRRFGSDLQVFYVERDEAEKRLTETTEKSELGVLEIKAQLSSDQILSNNATVAALKDKLLGMEMKQDVNVKPGKASRLKFGKAK